MAMFKKGDKEPAPKHEPAHKAEATHPKESAHATHEKAAAPKKVAEKEHVGFTADEVLAILRKKHNEMLAYAHTPEASKTDKSIEANAKAAWLIDLILEIEAAATAASEEK